MADKNDVLVNGVKLASEAVVAPGTSLLLGGQVKDGLIHVAAGLAARAFLGPIGYFLVAANSFSQSTTNKNLIETFKS